MISLITPDGFRFEGLMVDSAEELWSKFDDACFSS
jgi:hypothetical protein